MLSRAMASLASVEASALKSAANVAPGTVTETGSGKMFRFFNAFLAALERALKKLTGVWRSS
jgi:hypothetical protein